MFYIYALLVTHDSQIKGGKSETILICLLDEYTCVILITHHGASSSFGSNSPLRTLVWTLSPPVASEDTPVDAGGEDRDTLSDCGRDWSHEDRIGPVDVTGVTRTVTPSVDMEHRGFVWLGENVWSALFHSSHC